MKKAVLLPEQDCFLRILQILLIGVIALDGVEHVALEVGAHQLLRRLEVVVQNEPEDFVMLLVDLFAAGGLIVDAREQLEPGAELGVRFVETGAMRIGVEDLVELLGVLLPFRDRPAGERPVAGFDVLAQRLPQGVLQREDGILTADGTTLGADDGFGAAYMLAVLEDGTLPHPPLECVFTVQEETGTIGAEQLDKSLLKAKHMINLDGDEEGATFVACSCSDRVLLDHSYEG